VLQNKINDLFEKFYWFSWSFNALYFYGSKYFNQQTNSHIFDMILEQNRLTGIVVKLFIASLSKIVRF